MQLLSVIDGVLRLHARQVDEAQHARARATGFRLLDRLLPSGGVRCGAVHEVIDQNAQAWFFAAMLARSVYRYSRNGAVVWSDPQHELFPLTLAAAVPVDQLYLLQAGRRSDELWAICECLRSKGVGAVIASLRQLSRIEARRLQLAAEQGGGIGILLRPLDEIASPYAAATRWVVKPVRGDEFVQRWDVQLVHGHGGQVGKSVLLEVSRDTIDPNFVRAIAPMVHRPDQTKIARASA